MTNRAGRNPRLPPFPYLLFEFACLDGVSTPMCKTRFPRTQFRLSVFRMLKLVASLKKIPRDVDPERSPYGAKLFTPKLGASILLPPLHCAERRASWEALLLGPRTGLAVSHTGNDTEAAVIHAIDARSKSVHRYVIRLRPDGRPRRGRIPPSVEARYRSTARLLQRGRPSMLGSSGMANAPARRRRSIVDREVRRMCATSSMKSTCGVKGDSLASMLMRSPFCPEHWVGCLKRCHGRRCMVAELTREPPPGRPLHFVLPVNGS